MYLGTQKDNNNDVIDLNQNKFVSERKFSLENLREIFKLSKTYNQTAIAIKFNTTQSHISRILSKKRYKDLIGGF